jgi:benzoyl-CoA reductase subunit C
MNPELAQILSRAQTLYEDNDFKAVVEWKSAAPGRKAIGYMPTYVPRETIWAGGMLPVGVFGGGDRLEIVRGDAYFQSYICHIPRSTVELALTGRLNVLDGMLFPSICDVIRNLSGMWTMLFPGRYARYVDLPQNYDSRVGGEFWRRELAAMGDDMARLAGCPISDEALRTSIRAYNENRLAIRELYRKRSESPWLYPISQVYVVVRAGALLPPDEHTAMVCSYLELAAEESSLPEDRSRVVLAGMFCEQPPLGLLMTLERAGCWIVDDDLLLGLRWFTGEVPEEGDPITNLAQAYLTQSVSTASRYAPEGHRGQWLVDSVRRNRADGVIFCAPSFCDPALLEQPMLAAALERERIPHTQFKYSEDTGQFAVIREQAGTFSDSIRLWSEL